MPKLIEKLPLPQQRGEIVDSCAKLVDTEVSRKGGLGGLAVKAGYKVLKAIKPGAVRELVNALFDEFIDALEPFHAEYLSKEASGTFGGYMKNQSGAIAEALLQVTDRRAEKSKHTSLRKAFHSLRPSATRHVVEAIPALGVLMDRYYR